jgi:hypothetical protein
MVNGMSEDSAVADVEDLLGSWRRYEPDPRERAEATFALWLCTCYSEDAAPTWLVYDRAGDGEIAWCRVPDRMEPLDLVKAQDTAGNHTSAADVLLWLHRSEADPWGGSGSSSDAIVLETLREKLVGM